MLYASDLDRTLIYSFKLIDKQIIKDQDIKVVERLSGEPITYMTVKSIDLLKKIKDKLLFVPVTTRTLEQFQRIDVFKPLDLKYAVVANGGIIVENNSINKEWQNIITNKIADKCIDLHDAIKEFEKIKYDNWVKKLRIADELFFYCIVDENKIPQDELDDYIKWINEKNWIATRQGRKLYFIPKYVNKGDAVKFIADKENINSIAASGDSSLDLAMANVSNRFIVPKHGGICEITDGKLECMSYTTVEGIKAADEILMTIANYYNVL
ncbi:HAD family hydrolase [Clostridiaceae bacterium M8S5]|nr:HAD family hydrolase [Clostridiaceae bacterium M8S5]